MEVSGSAVSDMLGCLLLVGVVALAELRAVTFALVRCRVGHTVDAPVLR